MASQQHILRLTVLCVVMAIFTLSDVSSESSLHKVLKKSGEVGGTDGATVAVPAFRAKEFLSKLTRTKRNIWDRSRPDVQQWIMQFMSMGFDEQRLETDLSYWMDQARSTDHGRQHHYDENSPVGPRDRTSYRHGANVNYDYY
uniref:Uncharacterized protein n=2 Tax=Gouania willdenowi TaxID=441366 RepID=A0A8C5GJI1_GOUWI